MDRKTVKQTKWLAQFLIVSGALNVGLILAFFFLFTSEKLIPTFFDHKPAATLTGDGIEGSSNADLLNHFEKLSFEQLLVKLDSTRVVEDGFTERDLALGVLVSHFHFNISRSLLAEDLSPRILVRRGPPIKRTTIYPGLSEEEFKAVIHFARTEKWPLTAEGLFMQMQQRDKEIEPSLLEAFCLTPEFHEVEVLFDRFEPKLLQTQLVQLLREGDFGMLDSFAKEQRVAQDLSAARHQRFLLSYIERESKIATMALLQTHGAFAVKKLDDSHEEAILQLLDERTAYSEAFAKAMLLSPRSDAVWKAAAARLFAFAGETMAQPYDHAKALTRFIAPEVLSEKVTLAKKAVHKAVEEQKPLVEAVKKSKEQTHLVCRGDTLWKLARRYGVTVQEIKNANQMNSDSLREGKVIKIPREPGHVLQDAKDGSAKGASKSSKSPS